MSSTSNLSSNLRKAPLSLLYSVVMDSSSEDGEVGEQVEIGRRRKRPFQRRSPKKNKDVDPWRNNAWLQLLQDNQVKDPKTRQGKDFRRRFRVPYPVFERIVQICRTTGEFIFNYSPVDVTGQLSIPLELKILAVLRMLGDGTKFMTGSELSSFMSEATLNKFFKDFCSIFRKHFQTVFIKVPEGNKIIYYLNFN